MWTMYLLGCFLMLQFCGLCDGNTAGKDFATSFMQNYIAYYGGPVFQLQITSIHSNSCVTVSVPGLGFVQRTRLNASQGVTVTLPGGVEVYGSQKSGNTILVKATKDVCVSSVNAKLYTTDTSVVYPMSEWGVEYFIFTPGVSPPTMQMQIMFINGEQPNTVQVFLQAEVRFQGKLYTPGNKLVVDVQPFETVQLQSSQDFTGTRILSRLPVAVYSGHTCTWLFSKCNHVYDQLLPVPSWGTRYLVPPLSVQNQYDSVFVQASQLTQVTVQSSTFTTNSTLTPGQTVQFKLYYPDALSIKADKGIQVLFMFNGVQLSWSRMYDTFMANLLPNERFCYSYALNGQDGFDNRALLVVPSKDLAGIRFNGAPLPSSLQWRVVGKTEYSWAELVFQPGIGRHNMTHPSAAFGLYSMGLAMMNGYGASALCTVPVTCSNFPCNEDEECQMMDFTPTCVKKPFQDKPGTCWAMGDPHYRTFDGRYFDFMGTCTYVITKNCESNNSLPAFEVQTQNENRGNVQVSFVALVSVKVGGVTITIDRLQRGQVRINQTVWTLPVRIDEAGVNVSQSGLSVTVQTGFGLTVQYDWDNYLLVTLPAAFKSKVCGLCGNFNGNPDDDLTMPSNSQTPSAAEFGCSWKVSNLTDCMDCMEGRGDTIQGCDEEALKVWGGEQDCGILNRTAGGPFSLCHAVIDPDVYIQNCLFDTCMASGLRFYLCKALEVYADACQRAGAPLTDWRGESKCPHSCPENSHYELCGSACPATCMDPSPAGNCSSPCVEACTCNPGFVLSGAMCVPSNSCGCSQNGRYVPAGESFWADSQCSLQCRCPAGGGRLVCENTGCKAGQRCQVMNGIRNCYPVSETTCWAHGDPHYLSFDGRRFDFQGTCLYQLAGVCSGDPGLVPFEVLVQNEFRGSSKVSFTKLLQVKVYNLTIIISNEYKGSVMVNGVLLPLPRSLNSGHVSAFKSGWSAVVQTSFGLTVAFDWNSVASVSIPSTYMGAVCGLCGNFNGKAEDDLTLRGTNVSSARPDEFGASWRIADVPGCVNSCSGNCTDCDVSQRASYESAEYCRLLRDPKGPFMECHALLDPAGFFESCVTDVCEFRGRRDILCQAISSYMSACQDVGARVYPWRTAQFCGVQCPLNSHYEFCGPGCPASCYSLSSPLSCQRRCKEGCVCDQGFILSGDNCVPFAQCGCFYGGQYYQQGQAFYPDSLCQTECRCLKDGQVVCRNFSCGPYESCAVANGVRQCWPVGRAVCEAWGDPHYTSFDGQRFDFQGTCRYTLSQACNLQGTSLAPYSVEVENERWPNRAVKVSVTKQVSLAVFGYTFVLRQNTPQILVNGLLTEIPWSLNGSKVQISKEGVNYVVKTDFGLRVLYDLLYYVTVTVPSTYRSKTCGLCGNYDGNRSNDFLLPGGNLTTDVNAFGKAWKVVSPGMECEDSCQGTQCSECSPALMAVFEKPAYCGLLSDPAGPFAACHSVFDPTSYLRDCAFDVCVSEGSSSVACKSLEAFAHKCNTAGVAIRRWRTDSFCPLSCPVNSHYELCADPCAAACPGLTDVIPCSRVCAEGCVCDLGYLFDGHDCVQYQQCGCYRGGRVYKPGEVVLQAQCQQKCVCDPVMGLMCDTHTCSNGTQCLIRDGIMSCFHADPCRDARCREKETCSVVGGQAVCVPLYSATCWAWGDPHYLTFDGFQYDFQGTCRYVLSETCGRWDGLVPFSVSESNDNRGHSGVSFVREVTVEVYGVTVTIQEFQWGQIMVGGERLYLPFELPGGRVKVRQVGSAAVIETDFGLRVSYDWNSVLYLQLPSSYFSSVCGLCGNFNGNRGDELLGPGGLPQASLLQWTRSWRINESEASCGDGCERDCPVCSGDQQRLYGSDAYCGVLTSSDLFKACRAKVDPAVLQQSCVFDLCFSNGNHRLLCEALGAYSHRCRLEGVVITDWRDELNCPMPCQPNSHYEACASPHNSTCPSTLWPPSPTGVCVEACVCDPGFLLSGSTCVPTDECGCSYEGRYYRRGQSFWEDEKCVRRCVCDAALGVVVCGESSCPAGEVCAVVGGLRTCRAPGGATCEVYGDPHYRTLDGRWYDFQGSCVYQLVALCSNRTDLEPFNVTVQNERRGSAAVSFTRSVEVSVSGASITISREQSHQVLLNGLLVDLPLETRDVLAVYRGPNSVGLETTFGLQVTLEWTGVLRVSVPSVYRGSVCGLGGNYNGNAQDDFTLPDGSAAPDVLALGRGWQVGGASDCSSGASQSPNCTGTQRGDAQRTCGIITDQTGPFRDCHPVVDPGPYAANCVFDTCQFQGRHSVTCDAIAAYASACQSKGVTLRPWRNDTFCSLLCPPNSQYSLCAPGCVETCASVPAGCSRPCAEGCRCDPGFVFSGAACVPLAECGCFYGGRYYTKRSVFYSDAQCQLQCRCGENGAVACQRSSCGPGEACGQVGGVLGCHPTGYGSCLATGDPHYTSFDGRVFDFQGVCVYTLAKVCKNPGEKLTFFSVETENESVGRASVVKATTVSVYNLTIIIRRDELWRVKVNNEIINLPAALDGKIFLDQLGFGVKLQTDFGLQVLYFANQAEIRVPSIYNSSMCGLCGNYNGNPADDFLLPSGNQTSSADAFGQAWALTPPSVPCGGCEGPCLRSETDKAALYTGNDSCGLISSSAGPFSGCHKKVDPQPFANNCAFDMYAMDGSLTALCQSIQAYASACQQAGLNIQAWRNSSFCPPQCPSNSHYSLCSDSCANTCASLTWPESRCPQACLEGCRCDEGFVWEGAECVSLKNCGCVRDGKYLKVGEALLSLTCDLRCICLPGGILQCEEHNCSRGEVCDVQAGRRGCYPEPGRCVFYPSALLQSFDGAQGALERPGAFQMAFLCDDRSPEWFRVVADVRMSSGAAALGVDNLYVFLQDTFITVNRQKQSWVNGKKVSYPSAPSAEVLLEYTGQSVVIQRASSLRVELSNSQQLTLTLSTRLEGRVCGACGNFNRNLTDDALMADGRNSTLTAVLASWQAGDFSRCEL